MVQEKDKKNYNNPFTATFTGISNLFRKRKPSGTLSNERMDGKRVLVDGASSGLGFAVATELAARGADVIMACRSGIPAKGEEIRKITGSEKITMVHVDFSDSSSIKEMIRKVKEIGPVDVYICNAGIVPIKSRKTREGFEEMFMVNYLSKYLTIRLMLDEKVFTDKAVPRIVIVASESHRNPKAFEWETFGKFEEFTIGKSVERYGYFKLLLTTFAVELSRRINSNGLHTGVYTLCPGPVNSGIAREAPALFQPLLKLVFSAFFSSPKKAAAPVIYFAVSPEVEGKSFDYFFLMSRKDVDEKASDPENGKKLWEISEEILKTRQVL